MRVIFLIFMIGRDLLAYDAFQALELDRKLIALGLNGPEVAAAIGSIIGRITAPGSKLSTHGWLQKESGIGEFIDYDYEQCNLMRMY